MFDVQLLMVEQCGVLIGVGVSSAMVGLLLNQFFFFFFLGPVS
jgi:hypothetical protein